VVLKGRGFSRAVAAGESVAALAAGAIDFPNLWYAIQISQGFWKYSSPCFINHFRFWSLTLHFWFVHF